VTDEVSSTAAQAAPPASKIAYRTEILVRFADCDPAGMVFYPRYFEMFNGVVEDWCREGLQFSFADLHSKRGWGLPTVHIEAEFPAPSFLGEVLTATLAVREIGTTSITLLITFKGPDGVDRVRGQVVLVLIDLEKKRPRPLPDDMRARLM
jgi:4-hydroxybenzoyl-CoA thioesterase